MVSHSIIVLPTILYESYNSEKYNFAINVTLAEYEISSQNSINMSNL